MKFQVGDTVLIQAKVKTVDAKDARRPYRVSIYVGGMTEKIDIWPDAGEFSYLVDRPETEATSSDSVKPGNPATASYTCKFSVGDYVTSSDYPELGIGKITDNDKSSVPYRVEYSNGEAHWNSEGKLTKATKPEGKFKVGDRVTVAGYSEKGVGTVKVRDESDIPYMVEFSSSDWTWATEDQLCAAPVPEPDPPAKFCEGDLVIHINRPQMGVGKVLSVGFREFCGREYDAPGCEDSHVDIPRGPVCRVKYKDNTWSSAEKFLITAKIVE